MPNNYKTTNRRRPHRKVRGRKNKRNNDNKLVVYNDVGRFTADTLICKLRYTDIALTRSAASSTNAMNWYYRSSAYDPDPGVLSGAIPGFVELANLYRRYRVLTMAAKISIASQESNPVTIIAWPSNALINANSLTSDDLLEYGSNVGSHKNLMGNRDGMGLTKIHVTASGAKLYPKVFKTSEDYSGATSGNPNVMYGINIGAVQHYANFQYPLAVLVEVDITVQMYARRALET